MIITRLCIWIRRNPLWALIGAINAASAVLLIWGMAMQIEVHRLRRQTLKPPTVPCTQGMTLLPNQSCIIEFDLDLSSPHRIDLRGTR